MWRASERPLRAHRCCARRPRRRRQQYVVAHLATKRFLINHWHLLKVLAVTSLRVTELCFVLWRSAIVLLDHQFRIRAARQRTSGQPSNIAVRILNISIQPFKHWGSPTCQTSWTFNRMPTNAWEHSPWRRGERLTQCTWVVKSSAHTPVYFVRIATNENVDAHQHNFTAHG
jgi:hypothetical protein